MRKAILFDMYETLITLYGYPMYFSQHMAADMGIDVDIFRETWDATEPDRSIGKLTLEDALEIVMRKNHCYSEDLLKQIAARRTEAKRESFRHIHPEIVPMFSELKKRKIKIGLVSNCFSEEVQAIRESILFQYFDTPYMSYEQGVQKPDQEIFRRCMAELEVQPQECLYVGDGGSRELEVAEEIGMKSLRATWYLKEGTLQPVGKKQNFIHLETPCDVLKYIE